MYFSLGKGTALTLILGAHFLSVELSSSSTIFMIPSGLTNDISMSTYTKKQLQRFTANCKISFTRHETKVFVGLTKILQKMYALTTFHWTLTDYTLDYAPISKAGVSTKGYVDATSRHSEICSDT